MCVERVIAASAVRVEQVRIELGEERLRRLHAAAGAYGTSVEFMVQAAWTIVLHSLTGGGGLDETMPIRHLLAVGVRPAADAVVRIGCGEIGARVRVDRPGGRSRPVRRPRGADRAWLEVCVAPAVTLRLNYPAAGFGRCSADQLLDCVLRVLEAMMVAPDQPICRLEVLGDEDRRCILGRCAEAAVPGPAVVELFEDQVARRPHTVAVTDGARTLRYAALDRAANRAANWLLAHPSLPVVLDLPVSLDLVVGLLAALKAGTGCVIAPGSDETRPAGLTLPGDAVVRRLCPDSRPPRAAVAGAGAVVTAGGVTVHHDELLDLVLDAAPGPEPLAVLFSLITGATLVVMPDAVAA